MRAFITLLFAAQLMLSACGSGQESPGTDAVETSPDLGAELPQWDLAVGDLVTADIVPVDTLVDAGVEAESVDPTDLVWSCKNEITCGWLEYGKTYSLLSTMDIPMGVPAADWEFAKATIESVKLELVGQSGAFMGSIEFPVGRATTPEGAPAPKSYWDELPLAGEEQLTVRASVLPAGETTRLELGTKTIFLKTGMHYSFSWTWTKNALNAQNAFGVALTYDAGSYFGWADGKAYLVVQDPGMKLPAAPADSIRITFGPQSSCDAAQQWLLSYLPGDIPVESGSCSLFEGFGLYYTIPLPTPDLKLPLLKHLWASKSAEGPLSAE